VDAEGDTEDADRMSTDEQYKYLAKSTWVDESATQNGYLKQYTLYWQGRTLYVRSGVRDFPLPSIDGGLAWGGGGPQNRVPRYTLAEEDIETDKMTWRTHNGEVANVWFLQSSGDLSGQCTVLGTAAGGNGQRLQELL